MNENPSPISLACAALSDRGKVRMDNQDSFYINLEKGLFMVSDGLGGHQAGHVASEMIVSLLPDRILEFPRDNRSREETREWLRNEIVEMNRRIHRESESQETWRGMGATLVLALFRDERVYIAHVGDSRAYLLREGNLKQLTRDHSVVQHLLDQGVITPEMAKNHPLKHQITQYVGMEKDIAPDTTSFIPNAGDRLLLCSDGLTDILSERDILEILSEFPIPQFACEMLIAEGNNRGGLDNMSVVIINFVQCY